MEVKEGMAWKRVLVMEGPALTHEKTLPNGEELPTPVF
jgi:hypothetical protein